MRFEDVYAAVGPEEGRQFECPRCSAAEGEPCTYVAGRWVNSCTSRVSPGKQAWGRVFEIRPGDPMPGDVHPARKALARAARLERYRAEQRAERARLAAWWREHGHIFTDAGRA